MDGFRTTYIQHAFALWLLLLLLVLGIGLWVGLMEIRARRLRARVDGIFEAVDEDNMARLLVDYLATVRATSNVVNRIKVEHDQIAAVLPTVIRHVGLVRFSPFHDTGGDQSFALALLDGERSGVVITALHSRTDSRLYAKPVEHASSSYVLTPEEREAMQRALTRAPAETTA